MDSQVQETIGLGHNRPPLGMMLADNYKALSAEIDAAVASAGRAPETIADDVTLGKFGDLVRILSKLDKQAQDARKAEKEPFLNAGREVDTFFSSLSAKIADPKSVLLSRQTAYLSAKEAAARKIAEEEAARARVAQEEATRVANAALDAGNTDTAMEALSEAAQADERASVAEATVAAKPADLVRTYSLGGSVSTLKKEWTFEILDAEKLDASKLWQYVSLAEKQKAIRAFVKAGGRELAGVRIYEAAKASVR